MDEEEKPEDGEEEKQPEAVADDPWKERALAAEAGQQQAMIAMQQLLARLQQQPQVLGPVEPDYSDAEEVGLQPEQLRKIVAKAAAKMAPEIQRAAAPKESWDDRLDRLAEVAGEGVDKFDAAREYERARRTLGIQASERDVEKQTVKALRDRAKEGKINPAEEVRRTSVTSGGSRPPGTKASGEKKTQTWCDYIKADQRKRGLYAY